MSCVCFFLLPSHACSGFQCWDPFNPILSSDRRFVGGDPGLTGSFLAFLEHLGMEGMMSLSEVSVGKIHSLMVLRRNYICFFFWLVLDLFQLQWEMKLRQFSEVTAALSVSTTLPVITSLPFMLHNLETDSSFYTFLCSTLINILPIWPGKPWLCLIIMHYRFLGIIANLNI